MELCRNGQDGRTSIAAIQASHVPSAGGQASKALAFLCSQGLSGAPCVRRADPLDVRL